MTVPAYLCQVCGGTPHWRLDRRGDAVASWACRDDLANELVNLQRPWETTEIVVRLAGRSPDEPQDLP